MQQELCGIMFGNNERSKSGCMAVYRHTVQSRIYAAEVRHKAAANQKMQMQERCRRSVMGDVRRVYVEKMKDFAV